MHDLSRLMEQQLAEVGITLDPPKLNLHIVRVPVARSGVDRAAVRKTLIARGADERDLEWLTASAPSLEDARNFVPSRKRDRGALH
jgi:hypothetical protein